MRDNSGFNLLELMIVIIIIGVAAALAAPDMGSWLAKQTLNSAAREIVTSFSVARNQAIKGNGEDVRISFDVSDGWYKAVADTAGTVVPQTTLPNGISISNITFTQNSTGYNSRGAALDAGSVTILSSRVSGGNNYRTITLSLGGGVSISP